MSNSNTETTSSSDNDIVVNVNDYDQPVVPTQQPPQEIIVCVTIRNLSTIRE